MNKIFASLLMIGLVLGVAGAGTWAYFSDTETSEDNTFTAGTLDLKVNGNDEPSIGHYTEANWKPGETRDDNVIFTNEGSLNGSLNIKVANIDGIACTGDETEYCDDAADLDGADFDVVIKEGANPPLYSGLLSGLIAGVDVGTLDAGASRTLTMQATLHGGVGNAAQGDGIQFDIVATLTQV